MRLPTLKSVPESKRGPMSKEETKAMISLLMTGDSEPVSGAKLLATLREHYPEAAEIFEVKVMVSRLESTDQLYRPECVMMCVVLTDRVGDAVQWAYYLYEETRLRGPLTLHDMVNDFPMGFPTRDGYQAAWDAQKGYLQDPPIPKIDNLLDQAETWRAPVEEVA